MPKLTAKFLKSLLDSASFMSGQQPSPEMKSMLDVLISILLARQDDAEFRSFIMGKVELLAADVKQWEAKHEAFSGGETD